MSHYPNQVPPYGPYMHHPQGYPPQLHGYRPPHGHQPPHGYPPPQGYQPAHYPSPPHPYVPVPYIVPAYPPVPTYPPVQENPTYITNYIVQPAEPVAEAPPVVPEQVQVVENAFVQDIIDWVPATTSTALNYSARAVVAGHEGWDGSPLWVIRAHQGGELLPGKFAAKHRMAYVCNGGRELAVHNFEILCATPALVRWLPSSNGQVPVGAIPAGNTIKAEPLYIGRARHQQSLTPGKVHPSHQCCYIPFGGREVTIKHYEVLCKIVG